MGRRYRQLGDGGSGGHDGGGSLRWLLTYADMITLLMAFFIMLYSMSILNLNKFREVAVSIKSGFAGPNIGRGARFVEREGEVAGVPLPVVQKIQRMVKEKNLGKAVKLRTDDRGLIVSLVTDKVVFARGQADLSPHAKKIVSAIAEAIRAIPNKITVEGHTCDLPVASQKYPSNWELSTARATAVVRYLIEDEWMSPDRLSAAGYADSKPLVPNTSEGNRAQNRRVDIIIHRTESSDER